MEISYSPLVLKQSHYYAGGEFIIHASNASFATVRKSVCGLSSRPIIMITDLFRFSSECFHIIHLVSKYVLRAYYSQALFWAAGREE